jgi:aminoglycoside phosphotransferase (APT) family kinase protein
MPSAPSGTTRSPRLNGQARRYGSTPTDLHPANVLTADGAFCGVIDFGDHCAGDPACDLAAVWLLLPDDTTGHFYAAYQPTPDTWHHHSRGQHGPASMSQPRSRHNHPRSTRAV